MRRFRILPRDLAQQAVDALLAYRLRSALSIAGIVVGIATVVTALAIGEGARRAALTEIGALGIDNLYVRATADSPRSRGDTLPFAPALSLDDARVVAETLESDLAVAAMRVARVEMHVDARVETGSLAGVTVSWREIGRPDVAVGRWLSRADERGRRRVAVIGGRLARDLFPRTDPIGARVHAGGSWYYIVGRLRDPVRSDTGQAADRLDTDRSLLVPLTTMDVSLGAGDAPDRVQEIGVRVSGALEVEHAVQAIAGIMARRHRDAPRYELVVPRELLRARLRAQRTFNVVLVSIAALALLISGVGIMNIMLASVAERTQEVGVRRAFGARRDEIMVQFACEAATLCVAGAAAGVPLGAAMSGVVTLAAGWPISISAWAVLLALLLATTVGLVFGIYPAKVAASIQPIDALRAP